MKKTKKTKSISQKVGKSLAFKDDPAWTKKDIKVFDDFVVANQFVKVSLKITGKWFHAEGVTVLDALQNLDCNPKGTGVLVIEQNGKKREKIINGRILWQLLKGSKTMKEIAIKHLNTFL